MNIFQKLKSPFVSKNANLSLTKERLGESCEPDSQNTLRFTVTPAQGGTIISMRYYDSRKDENFTKLYVISDDQDLKNEISNILSIELLRNN
jgi:hypothetical protein